MKTSCQRENGVDCLQTDLIILYFLALTTTMNYKPENDGFISVHEKQYLSSLETKKPIKVIMSHNSDVYGWTADNVVSSAHVSGTTL